MHGSTLCPGLFGFVFLGAVRAAAWAPPKDKSEHHSEALNIVVVSEDEASLLQAGTTNLHPKIDHGHYGMAKDVAYATDEHKNDDTDTKVKYGENRHDKASYSAYAKEENHKYTYHQAQSTHYDTDYHSKNHDYTHSMAKDSHYDRYQKTDYDGGDSGESQYDAYAQGKDNTDDSYAKAKYDEDQHGKASGYGYAKEEKHKYAYHHAQDTPYDSDYHGKNYDHAHSVVKDSHYDRYQKSDYDDGDSGKSQDDAYAQGKDKADDSYAKVKYGEDQHGKASVYGYAKEEKDKYTYRHAKSTQYDSDYPANNYHYAHSTTKDSYADHYKNSEYGHVDSGKVGDEIYTQDTKHKHNNYDEKGNNDEKYNNMYDCDKYHGDCGEGKSDGDSYYSKLDDYAYAKKRSDNYHDDYKEGEGDGDDLGKSRDYYRDAKYDPDYSGMIGHHSSAREDYLGENEYNNDYYRKTHEYSYGKGKEDHHGVYYR